MMSTTTSMTMIREASHRSSPCMTSGNTVLPGPAALHSLFNLHLSDTFCFLSDTCHNCSEEGAFDPQEQGNDFGGGYDDNMNMDEVAAPFSGSKYGRAELMEEMEDTRPGVGALKVREEDLMGERAATGPTNHEYRASDFSVRTAMVRDVLKDQLKEAETVSFQSISKGVSRRTAAACFLEVHVPLLLRSYSADKCALCC